LRLAKKSQFIPLQNVVYFITLPFLVRKIFTFYLNDVLLYKRPFPGPNFNFLEPSGPLQACNGTDLTFFLLTVIFVFSTSGLRVVRSRMLSCPPLFVQYILTSSQYPEIPRRFT